MDTAAPMLFDSGLMPTPVEPKVVDARLTARIAEAKRFARQVDEDLAAFDDPPRRRALIHALAEEQENVDSTFDDPFGDVDPFGNDDSSHAGVAHTLQALAALAPQRPLPVVRRHRRGLALARQSGLCCSFGFGVLCRNRPA